MWIPFAQTFLIFYNFLTTAKCQIRIPARKFFDARGHIRIPHSRLKRTLKRTVTFESPHSRLKRTLKRTVTFESPHSRLKRTLKRTFTFSAKIERRTEIIEGSQSVTRSVGKHGANGKTHVAWHRS